jgi:hypothetical protein
MSHEADNGGPPVHAGGLFFYGDPGILSAEMVVAA